MVLLKTQILYNQSDYDGYLVNHCISSTKYGHKRCLPLSDTEANVGG